MRRFTFQAELYPHLQIIDNGVNFVFETERKDGQFFLEKQRVHPHLGIYRKNAIDFSSSKNLNELTNKRAANGERKLNTILALFWYIWLSTENAMRTLCVGSYQNVLLDSVSFSISNSNRRQNQNHLLKCHINISSLSARLYQADVPTKPMRWNSM